MSTPFISPLAHRSFFVVGACTAVFLLACRGLLQPILGHDASSSLIVAGLVGGALGVVGVKDRLRTFEPLDLYGRLLLGVALCGAVIPFITGLGSAVHPNGLVAGTVLTLLVAGPTAGLTAAAVGVAARGLNPSPTDPPVSSDKTRFLVLLLAGFAAGVWGTVFLFFDLLGYRQRLWLSSAVLLLVAMATRNASRNLSDDRDPRPSDGDDGDDGTRPPWSVRTLLTAMIVGMLGAWFGSAVSRLAYPVLGASSYASGLMLFTLAAGAAVGIQLYRETSGAFRGDAAGTAAMTVGRAMGKAPLLVAGAAFCVAAPFAGADFIALTVAALRPMSAVGFWGWAAAHAAFPILVILPAAVAGGFALGLGLDLLGPEAPLERRLARLAPWIVGGALVGVGSGRFLLMPRLGAEGLWRLVPFLLVLVAAWLRAVGRSPSSAVRDAVGLLLIVTAGWAASSDGPGPMTRLGGNTDSEISSSNAWHRWNARIGRGTVSSLDGAYRGVSLRKDRSLTLTVDGEGVESVLDAPQIQAASIGTALHPAPKRALLLGFGSGLSGDFLTRTGLLEDLDVIEPERRVVDVAAAFTSEALFPGASSSQSSAPRPNLVFGDPRARLRASDHLYDLILAPSWTLSRSDMAHLQSREMFQDAASHLAPGGLFLQTWDAHDEPPALVQSLYDTLLSVFPTVETWQLDAAHLLLVATNEPSIVGGAVADRIHREPWSSLLSRRDGALASHRLDSFYSAFVGTTQLARTFSARSTFPMSTDDRPTFTLARARSIGTDTFEPAGELRRVARLVGADVPDWTAPGEWNRPRIAEQAAVRLGLRAPDDGSKFPALDVVLDAALPKGDAELRHQARRSWGLGQIDAAARLWGRVRDDAPRSAFDRLMIAELRALGLLETNTGEDLLRNMPLEQDLLRAAPTGPRQDDETLRSALRAVDRLGDELPVYPALVERVLRRIRDSVSTGSASDARELFERLDRPFAGFLLEEERLETRMILAESDFDGLCLDAFAAFEPFPAWERRALERRLECYRIHDHPRRDAAEMDLERFTSRDRRPLRLTTTAQGAS